MAEQTEHRGLGGGLGDGLGADLEGNVEGNVEGGGLAGRTRRAAADLRALLRDRAAEEAAIADRLNQGLADTQSARDDAVRTADTTRDDRLTRLKTSVEKADFERTARAEKETADATKRHDREHAAEADRLDSARERAETSLRDARFLTDAVTDAGRGHPAMEVERVRSEVKSELEILEMLEAEARRLAGPRVVFPSTRGQVPGEHADEAEDDVRGDRPALDLLRDLRIEIEDAAARMGGFTLHTLFRFGLPVIVLFLLVVAIGWAGVAGLMASSMPAFIESAVLYAGPVAVVLLLLVPLRSLALAGTRKRVAPIAANLLQGRGLAVVAVRQAEAYKARADQEIMDRRQSEVAAHKTKYESRLRDIKAERDRTLAKITEAKRVELEALRAKHEAERAEQAAKVASRHGVIGAEHAASVAAAEESFTRAIEAVRRAHADDVAELAARWRRMLTVCREQIDAAWASVGRSCPPWDAVVSAWSPGDDLAPAVCLGSLGMDLATLEGGLPRDAVLAEGVPDRVDVPFLLDFPGPASLLVLADEARRADAIEVLRGATLRLLTTLPPGKVRLTMIDPVGLGQSFAGMMRLADHDDKLVTNRIWTEMRHIEARLADLTEHMETVIQKYLRNEFESIEAYNDAAGEIAEPYRFLVIADLPKGFSDEAARRLMSVIESGPRCGVFTLIHADPAAKMPETAKLDAIAAASTVLRASADGFAVDGEAFEGLPLALDAAPTDGAIAPVLDRLGALSQTAGRVEVPFGRLAPAGDAVWSRDASEEVEIPLGRAGATRHQTMRLGRGTSQHVLIAGKTGSGKSTLLHVMITTSAMWYSPAEIEYYLVDFKKGVEFKAYAEGRLPHARAVAVESDREFGLSVLQRLDEELKRRGDLFRAHGAQSLGAARRAAPDEHLPRVMLVIDEFQEFFTEDDKVAQDAALLLDRLVRQGRAFGMHILLGSQTLSGAYSLARSTVGQMAVRIALQCSETDSYLILSEDNAAARMLSRPGEAIYNDANGLLEGNNPFQVAWLSDEQRDGALTAVCERVAASGWSPPTPQIVFEGNIPADLSRNHLLWRAMDATVRASSALHCWMGEPVAIKDPTAGVLRRQAGSNVLVVGQQEETARAMMASSLIGLIAQMRGTKGSIRVIDPTPPDDPDADALRGIVERLGEASGVDVRVHGPRGLDGVLEEMDAERARREADPAEMPSSVLLVHGVHRLRALRKKDDGFSFSFSGSDDDDAGGADAGSRLAELLREGPPVGMHVVAWCDTYANATRTLDRAALGEFEQRVVLQMSASDSSNLIDTPAAGKLGMNRGLVFTEEFGSLEKFRPYSMPDAALIERAAAAMGR